MYYTIIPQSNELYHYGVQGMHWGVRRYQNYDGTRIGKGSGPVTGGKAIRSKDRPTGTHYTAKLSRSVAAGQGGKAKGNARLAANAGDAKPSMLTKLTDKSVRQGKGKDNISPAEKIIKDTRTGIDNSERLTQELKKHDPKLKKEQAQASEKAHQMSDKELRESINRIKMEREYVSLTTEETASGYDKARDVLEIVGDVAGITLAILGIVTTIKGLKHDDLDSSDQEDMLDILVHSGDFDDEFIQHAMDLDEEYIEDYLEHHGILGQKWGVRRFQNYDGTRIGTGGGGGGSTASSKFRNSVAGGQGGKAKGNARLAAKAPSTTSKISPSTQTVGEAYKISSKATKELDDLGEELGKKMFEADMKLNGDKYSDRMKSKAREDYRMMGHEEARKQRPDLAQIERDFVKNFDNFADGNDDPKLSKAALEYYIDLWMDWVDDDE